jgi:hypothetical protein
METKRNSMAEPGRTLYLFSFELVIDPVLQSSLHPREGRGQRLHVGMRNGITHTSLDYPALTRVSRCIGTVRLGRRSVEVAIASKLVRLRGHEEMMDELVGLCGSGKMSWTFSRGNWMQDLLVRPRHTAVMRHRYSARRSISE